LEVDENIIATDLHELIYRQTTSVNDFDGSRYAVTTLLAREEYKSILRPYFVTG